MARKAREERSEKGQASVELLLLVMGMVMITSAIIFFGRVLYVNLAVQAAAYDGARVAVETLSLGRGVWEARQAVEYTLYGWHLDPEAARIIITFEPWSRGSRVQCAVYYDVRVSDLPLLGWFYSGGAGVRVSADTTLRVEQYKSRWD